MRQIRVTDLDPDNLDPENFCSSGLQVHPAAAMFPLMEGKELELFCSDIQAAGLNNPIVIQGDVLLDGRNRFRVCAQGGGASELYILSLVARSGACLDHLPRRSLTDEQRGAIAVQIYD
jgi:hypothetical protein